MMNLKTNQDILLGEWKQLQGAMRQQWGKLTNDDVMVAQGHWEQVVGQLQSHYGYTRADAETRLDAFLNHWNLNVRDRTADVVDDAQSGLASTLQSAKSAASDTAQQTQQAVSQTAQQVQDTAVHVGKTVDKKVKRNRWKMLIMVLLAGMGIGYWLSNQ